MIIENSYFKDNLIDIGETLFDENCVTCHQSDGSGKIDPNLTDDYWINRKEKDLFKIFFLSYGMEAIITRPWVLLENREKLKETILKKISNYVYFINQKSKKRLTSKAPQGKKITEWSKI